MLGEISLVTLQKALGKKEISFYCIYQDNSIIHFWPNAKVSFIPT